MTSPDGTTISPPARDLPNTRRDDRYIGTEVSAHLAPTRDHFVFDGGTLRIIVTGSPPLVVISGEVDELTYSGLVDVLEKAAENPGPIQVDLAGVEYCDLAGLRAIVRLTGASGHDYTGPRTVVLHGLPPHLTAVLRIVGWDSTPGLILHS